ncbi:hypothetical protein ACJX0J_028497, partial [Zea mays]
DVPGAGGGAARGAGPEPDDRRAARQLQHCVAGAAAPHPAWSCRQGWSLHRGTPPLAGPAVRSQGAGLSSPDDGAPAAAAARWCPSSCYLPVSSVWVLLVPAGLSIPTGPSQPASAAELLRPAVRSDDLAFGGGGALPPPVPRLHGAAASNAKDDTATTTAAGGAAGHRRATVGAASAAAGAAGHGAASAPASPATDSCPFLPGSLAPAAQLQAPSAAASYGSIASQHN